MRECLCALLLAVVQRDPVHSPVVITAPVVVASEHAGFQELQYDLTNRSSQAITGWGIRFEITFADGRKRTGGFGMVGPLTESGPDRRGVPSRATLRQAEVLGADPASPVADVSVTLTWVIFADRSSFGDAREIDTVFARRERRYQEENFVIATLRAAQKEASGVDALRAALRSLANAPETLTHVRGNLQRGIDGKVPFNPDAYLIALIESHEDARDRLAPHLRPR